MPARILIAVVALAVLPEVASAQIYTWRDTSGTLVLSDRPNDSDAIPLFPVARANQIRSTRPVAATRASRYDALITEHAATQQIRADLVRAVIQTESAFNPRAVSPKGAMGLMQLMPGTARDLGVLNPFDPAQNIRGGIAYLRRLLDRYNNNEELALAAYNAGPAAVDKYGRKVPPYREAKAYVSKIARVSGVSHSGSSAMSRIYKSVETIDGREVVRYSNIKPASEFELVDTRRQ